MAMEKKISSLKALERIACIVDDEENWKVVEIIDVDDEDEDEDDSPSLLDTVLDMLPDDK